MYYTHAARHGAGGERAPPQGRGSSRQFYCGSKNENNTASRKTEVIWASAMYP